MSVYEFKATLLKNMIPLGWKGVWYAIRFAISRKHKTHLILSFISLQEVQGVSLSCFDLRENFNGGKYGHSNTEN